MFYFRAPTLKKCEVSVIGITESAKLGNRVVPVRRWPKRCSNEPWRVLARAYGLPPRPPYRQNSNWASHCGQPGERSLSGYSRSGNSRSGLWLSGFLLEIQAGTTNSNSRLELLATTMQQLANARHPRLPRRGRLGPGDPYAFCVYASRSDQIVGVIDEDERLWCASLYRCPN